MKGKVFCEEGFVFSIFISFSLKQKMKFDIFGWNGILGSEIREKAKKKKNAKFPEKKKKSFRNPIFRFSSFFDVINHVTTS